MLKNLLTDRVSKWAKLGVALLLLASASLGVTAPASASDMAFYQEASALIKDNWSEDYFGSISMTIGSPVLVVDNEEVAVDPGRDTVPFVAENRTMLPFRSIAETMGGEVAYESDTQTVRISTADSDIDVVIGSDSMTVNGDSVSLDAAATIREGRTYVPVRAVTEALGCSVAWEADTQTVHITNRFQTKRLLVKTDGSALDAAVPGVVQQVFSAADHFYVLQFATQKDCEDAYAQLSAAAGIDYVEPDLYIPPVDHESPRPAQAEGNRSGSLSWGPSRIGADIAAQALAAKNDPIVVAVVDSGVDPRHPFLNDRMAAGGYDFVNNDSQPDDDNSHGTHVAGIIADATPGLSNVKILPVKVLGTARSGTWLQVGMGIKYASDRGADVINLSLGGGHSNYCDEAVSYALARGSVVVTSAGNSNADALSFCPAHIPAVITVSAVDSSDLKCSFSNFGAVIDVAAPGMAINSSVPGGGYENKNGTSMAAPFVSAAVAMFKLNAPTATAAEVEALIKANVDNMNYPWYYGAGIINLTNAFSAPVKTPPVKTPPVETPPVETPPVETPPVETPPVEIPPVKTPPVEKTPAISRISPDVLYSDGSIQSFTIYGVNTHFQAGITRVKLTYTGAEDGTTIDLRQPKDGTTIDLRQPKEGTTIDLRQPQDGTTIDLRQNAEGAAIDLRQPEGGSIIDLRQRDDNGGITITVNSPTSVTVNNFGYGRSAGKYLVALFTGDEAVSAAITVKEEPEGDILDFDKPYVPHDPTVIDYLPEGDILNFDEPSVPHDPTVIDY